MTIAQSYATCAGISAFLAGLAVLMLYMGVFRRGEASEFDDSAARLITIVGAALLVLLAAFWSYALSKWPF